MQFGTFFLTVLLATGAGGAVLTFVGSDEPSPLIAKTRGLFGNSEHVTLEKAADYWLASGDGKRAGQSSGAGPR